MSFRFFKVTGHSSKPDQPPSCYRVTKKSDGSFRCTCRNYIFNRNLSKYTEDKHITDVKEGADNVEEITNPAMIAALQQLDLLVEAVEFQQETYMMGSPPVAVDVNPLNRSFGNILFASAPHNKAIKEALTPEEYVWLIEEVQNAYGFWQQFDTKRRGISELTKPEPTPAPSKKGPVYFL
jgi:hypothetical protein